MKKIIYLFLILMVGITACNDNFLDQKPLDSFSDDAVWQDLALVETFVNDLYRGIYADNSRGGNYYAALSDEAFNQHDYGTVAIVQGRLTPDLAYIGWGEAMQDYPWNINYRWIKNVNMFFEKITETPTASEADETWKKYLIGQAHFLRAYFYFDLYRLYGSVPIIKNTFALDGDYSGVQRAPMDDVLEFIVSECDNAFNNLPYVYPKAIDFGRSTKGAALGLKARALLYGASPLFGTPSAAKWQRAADANKAVIDLKDEQNNPVYSLVPVTTSRDYEKIFINQNSKEIIFQKLYNNTGGTSNSGHTFNDPSSFDGWGTIQPSQQIVDMFQNADGTDFVAVDSTTNPYVSRELRFHATITYDGSMWGAGTSGSPYRRIEIFRGGADSRQGPVYWNSTQTGYYMRKFMDIEYDRTAGKRATEPWIFMRLAEFYLNYAECLIELGDNGGALNILNTYIRDRVHLPALDGSNIVEQYRRERAVELVFEGHRYFDIRRWKIYEASMTNIQGMEVIRKINGTDTSYVYNPLPKPGANPIQRREISNPRSYWIPIPRSELRRAPQLDPTPYS